MTVQCIAEIASAHDGVLEKALRLVDAAADAGADVVKAQYFHDPDKMAERRRVPELYRDIYRRYSVPEGWLPILRDKAHERGLKFACTAYLAEAVPVMAQYADILKVASFEAMDVALLKMVDVFHKPVIVSAGMCSASEVGRLREWRYQHSKYAIEGENAYLLHCVSQYPVDLSALNLAVIRQYELDGFSDHTANVSVGGMATLAGARIIETHIRLEDTDPANPDFAPALSPAQYVGYVKGIRAAEVVLGDGVKRQQPCEAEMARYRVKT